MDINDRIDILSHELDKVSGRIYQDSIVGDLVVMIPDERRGEMFRHFFIQNIDKNSSIFGTPLAQKLMSLDHVISQIKSGILKNNQDFPAFYCIVWKESAVADLVPQYVGVDINYKLREFIQSIFNLYECSYKYIDKNSILLSLFIHDQKQIPILTRQVVKLNMECYGWDLGGERATARSLKSGELYFGLK